MHVCILDSYDCFCIDLMEWHRKFEMLPLKFVFGHVCVSPANLKTKATWGRSAIPDAQLLTI